MPSTPLLDCGTSSSTSPSRATGSCDGPRTGCAADRGVPDPAGRRDPVP